MIQTTKGNVLSVTRGIIVHGCNCHGVMGGGIAKSIKAEWPGVFKAYRAYYEAYGLRLGEIIPVASPALARKNPRLIARQWVANELPEDVIVVNAMTQYDYGRDPDIVYVDYDAVLATFARSRILAKATGLPVHFPLIGCGLANGKWDRVGPLIEAGLGNEVQATLWEFQP